MGCTLCGKQVLTAIKYDGLEFVEYRRLMRVRKSHAGYFPLEGHISFLNYNIVNLSVAACNLLNISYDMVHVVEGWGLMKNAVRDILKFHSI